MMRSFAVVLFSLLVCAANATATLTLCCRPENDLYRVLQENQIACQRVDTPEQAIASGSKGGGVLLLADDYPSARLDVSDELLRSAKQKGLRIYLEYPSGYRDFTMAPVTSITVERAVVTGDALGKSLPRHKLLSVSGCHYVPTSATASLLSIARVAGYDKAEYGLPPSAHPLLFEDTENQALVATTCLSQFRHGRYAPAADWAAVWSAILTRIAGSDLPPLQYTPRVRPMYSPDEPLPGDIEMQTVQRAADWILSSGLLLQPERAARVQAALAARGANEPLDLAAISHPGDGSHGILEGYSSNIRWDGNQDVVIPVRADCVLESAMVLASAAKAATHALHVRVATNLLNFAYGPAGFVTGKRADPGHAAYGLIAWGLYSPDWEKGNYGDDNARAIVATLAAGSWLNNPAWDEPALRATAANFRTTGKKGFRNDRVDMEELEGKKWQHFADREIVNLSPHFEAALWACYLLAYERTGYTPFLEKTRAGIARMMEAYPAGWRWGDNSERTDMLWTLAWLLRADDQPQHREWLHRVANDLVATMDPTGAIPERLAGTGGGHYQVPQSNELFGVGESPLIHNPDDPVSDQLYTTAFALIALHEAAGVTGDTKLKEAEDRLAKYLCRIQVRAESLPYLNGTWFRAFDYKKWDYWASSGDIGWGPWCAEAGWGHMWIATMLTLRQENTTLWELLTKRDLKQHWPQIEAEMFKERK